MTEFRIGLFYPTSTSVHVMSPLLADLNPDVRVTRSHADLIGAVERAGLDYVLLADAWGSRGPASTRFELGDPMMMGPVLAAQLLAVSTSVKVVNTMHQAWLHPLVIARLGANLSTLGGGRWGMNAVSGVGYNPDLLRAVVPLTEHDEFYSAATESMEIVMQAWRNEGRVDFEGKFYEARGQLVGPHPEDVPPVVSAGASPAGCEFAGRFASMMFIPGESSTSLLRDRREMINAAAERAGRDGGEVKFLLNASVVLGETEDAADALSEQLFDSLDPEAIAEIVGTTASTSDTYKVILDQMERVPLLAAEDRPITHASVTDWLRGDPVQIADAIEEIHARDVCEGISLSFAVWQPAQIELFGKKVVPLLEERGIWSRADRRGSTW